MSVCLCLWKIANKSHRNVKAEWYLDSGTDSISCSLTAAVTEMYLFFLLCRFGFLGGEWFLLVFWGEFCSLVGFLFGFVWVFFFYRLVFSTCVLDKLVIFSLKKKVLLQCDFRQVYFCAFSAHLFHLSSPHLTSDVFCYLGFLPNILTGSYKKRKPLKCRTKEVIQAANW